ncbi:MAG: hypothetical protein DRP65_00955 [Planctomycetota bacterium]|mgnify:CR=1 FL=1|nr:MAG: hypothetical protein DRP65_00955 [Planctomycetota bacterium]
MKLLFHIHSSHSFDAVMSVSSILRKCRKLGIDGVVICDHNTFANQKEITEYGRKFDVLTIPAIEYATELGDIIGLFVNRQINSRDMGRIIESIKEQDGLSVLPHPLKNHHKLPRKLLEQIDIIEVYNSRCSEKQNESAQLLAEDIGKPTIAGSDAHFFWELQNAIVEFAYNPSGRELNGKDMKQMFLQSPANYRCRESSLVNIFLSQLVKAVKLKNPNLIISLVINLILGLKRKVFMKTAKPE